MRFRIEIVEGHDSSSYFWFKPVILKESGKILWDDVIELDEEFSIEETDIDCFLSYFFYKYFDENLTYNKRRYDCNGGYISGFEWNLTHNFYTYDGLNDMVQEIDEIAYLLEFDYHNPYLDAIKWYFPNSYLCYLSDPDVINGNHSVIQNHIDVVIDFYKRVTKRITIMMENNRNADAISIMGP